MRTPALTHALTHAQTRTRERVCSDMRSHACSRRHSCMHSRALTHADTRVHALRHVSLRLDADEHRILTTERSATSCRRKRVAASQPAVGERPRPPKTEHVDDPHHAGVGAIPSPIFAAADQAIPRVPGQRLRARAVAAPAVAAAVPARPLVGGRRRRDVAIAAEARAATPPAREGERRLALLDDRGRRGAVSPRHADEQRRCGDGRAALTATFASKRERRPHAPGPIRPQDTTCPQQSLDKVYSRFSKGSVKVEKEVDCLLVALNVYLDFTTLSAQT
jgi:hypothetical protein